MLEKILVAMHNLHLEPGFPADGADFWTESAFFSRFPWRAADRRRADWARPWDDATLPEVRQSLILLTRQKEGLIVFHPLDSVSVVYHLSLAARADRWRAIAL